MKNQDLSNFNKFIVMLKLHWKKMSLIGSMALKRSKTFGTLFKEPMKAPNPRRKPRGNSLKGNLIDFIMLDDEVPQEMYNRLKKLVNKVRTYDSRR
jgi:hypothetical protein